MAFDFHIRSDFDAPLKTSPSCQLEEDLHRDLFAFIATRADDYPLLMESSQFANDSFYHGDDIDELVEELERLCGELAAQPRLNLKLRELIETCARVQVEGGVLQGIAD